jgi:hypothetical protein
MRTRFQEGEERNGQRAGEEVYVSMGATRDDFM